VNVVVNMLASNGWLGALSHLGSTLDTGALELTSLLLETSLDGSRIAVVVFTGLDRGHLVLVLFGEDLTVLHRLDGGVVVVLMNLTVDGFLHILVARLHHLLLDDGGGNLLVHGGVYLVSVVNSAMNRRSELPYHGDQPCA